MKEQITRLTCDRCGVVDVPGTQDLAVTVKPSNYGGDDTVMVADLCPNCLLFLIEESLSSHKVDARRSIVDAWAKKSKPVVWREELR